MTTLADIFRLHGPAYLEKFGTRMPPSHPQAIRAIQQCRTAALGGHVFSCPSCEKVHFRYHSCRNRHCPQCQGARGHAWLAQQRTRLLPTPYFFLTFTLPEDLRPLVRRHQKQLYPLLFRTAAAAMQTLAQDPRFVGGQLGMLAVLHTWGRNLSFHPHIHFLVPAGGLAPDGTTWCQSRKHFLLPVKALSKIFRAKFRDALRKTSLFPEVPPAVWTQPWVVHSKSVGDGQGALQYLAPYIFRVALSNQSILALHNGRVTFRFRETESGKLKTVTFSAEEFIRRFLLHVLPKGFVKVRYYGLFSPAHRRTLAALRTRLRASQPDPAASSEADPSEDLPPLLCPACGQPLRLVQRLPPLPNPPP